MNVTAQGRTSHYRTVSFDAAQNHVRMIEQRLLPHVFEIVAARTYQETAHAITDMIVRGAGAIGATAAYGFAQGLREFRAGDMVGFAAHEEQVFQVLAKARPTAVDPVNALRAIRAKLAGAATIEAKQALALREAEAFAEDDVRHCRELGERGAPLIREGMRVLTHCNAGWLAFVDIGSATAPLYAAHRLGRKFHVFCGETRPRSQGATLTAWELAQEGLSHQVISDNAAGHLMQRGQIDLVITGADRVLGRTGEAANKIGTYTRAVLAQRHGIPFYVAMPLSTIDWETASGFDIPIEERHESEVLGAWGVTNSGQREYVRVANPASHALNPGFDVTPAELITGFITPAGILAPGELMRRRAELGSAN